MFRVRIEAHIAGAWFHMVARERRGREIAIDAAAQVGRDGSAFAVDAVALNTGERLE